MKRLSEFMNFDAERFFAKKLLEIVSISDWIDENKNVLGTKFKLVIIADKTEYEKQDGTTNNKYETFNTKIANKHVDDSLKVGDKVRIVNVIKSTVWGDYKNQLSIEAEGLQVIKPTQP